MKKACRQRRQQEDARWKGIHGRVKEKIRCVAEGEELR